MDSRKRGNGSRGSVVFLVNLSNLPYQPRPNPVVNEGGGSQKRSMWHNRAFGSPVPQHKACKLPRHCCLAHSTLLALQKRWSLIATTHSNLSGSKSYLTCDTTFFLIERNNLHILLCQGHRKDASVPLGLLKVREVHITCRGVSILKYHSSFRLFYGIIPYYESVSVSNIQRNF